MMPRRATGTSTPGACGRGRSSSSTGRTEARAALSHGDLDVQLDDVPVGERVLAPDVLAFEA
jgi:hypothetical protein